MHQTQPLPDTHPELTVTEYDGFTEYRVAHWRLARDGSGRIVGKHARFSLVDALVLVLAVFCLTRDSVSRGTLVCAALIPVLVWNRCTQVLHDSLLVFPTLGIQLETHRGHPLLPLSTSRYFIPLSSLEDVIIHEGLRRWDVRYYLAALQRRRRGDVCVHVAFENVLPYFPVLEVVYLGVQETLFSSTRTNEGDN